MTTDFTEKHLNTLSEILLKAYVSHYISELQEATALKLSNLPHDLLFDKKRQLMIDQFVNSLGYKVGYISQRELIVTLKKEREKYKKYFIYGEEET